MPATEGAQAARGLHIVLPLPGATPLPPASAEQGTRNGIPWDPYSREAALPSLTYVAGMTIPSPRVP